MNAGLIFDWTTDGTQTARQWWCEQGLITAECAQQKTASLEQLSRAAKIKWCRQYIGLNNVITTKTARRIGLLEVVGAPPRFSKQGFVTVAASQLPRQLLIYYTCSWLSQPVPV